MESLNEDLLLEIFRRIDDSDDVARCRLVSKRFDRVSYGIHSINLRLNPANSYRIMISFKTIFLNFLSKLSEIESMSLSVAEFPIYFIHFHNHIDNLYLNDSGFILKWLPRVSHTLKTLSITESKAIGFARQSDLVLLVSLYCSKLLDLKLKCAWLSLYNMTPMPNLTSLRLELIRLEFGDLNLFNNCFPNLQDLEMISYFGSINPLMIHLLNLKTFQLTIHNTNAPIPSSLSIITPNLITLRVESRRDTTLHVEAPMLSNFHLAFDHVEGFTAGKFENLKTLSLDSRHFGSLLFRFPVTESVENLTIDSQNVATQDAANTKFTFGKLFSVFPKVSTLCVKSGAWSELEARYNPLGWEPWDGREGFTKFCAYIWLVDPSATLTNVAILLNHCTGLLDASFLIHRDVDDDVLRSFIFECMHSWPKFDWRWGTWKEGTKDSWISI